MNQPASILVINAGSSSIKFAVYSQDLSPQIRGQIDGIGSRPHLVATRADNIPIIDRNWDGTPTPMPCACNWMMVIPPNR